MNEALKPCPFCGSPAERGIFGSGKGHIVACSSDHCDGKVGMERSLSRDEVTKAWNTRAAPEQREPVARVTLEATSEDAVLQSVTFTKHGIDLPEGTLLYATPRPARQGR